MKEGTSPERKPPLYYTFANHMHWVDMEWLWGYDALPGSTTDMLEFSRVTGARGNVNFDVVGYEKLAVEAPDVLEELKAALASGTIEVVGATYAQPYGGFHGGESAIRQHTYGVRRATHLLGVRPRTFWEEEFHFFPQLPQILAGVGMTHAHLFFPWTWETPIVPREELPVVWWEGIDGTRILTGTHNDMCLHQWPEELAEHMESGVAGGPGAGVIQWLELMPAEDWMCRSELMTPPLLKLIESGAFDLQFVTISEYLDAVAHLAEVRRYTMDDVFHGMSLGKNGDHMRRRSRHAEHVLQSAEAVASVCGLFGPPYPYWDVYPGWELEEGWRDLLVAQHHDIHASEALCAHVGLRSFERSTSLGLGILDRTLSDLAARSEGPPGRTLAFNPLGWRRRGVFDVNGVSRAIELGPFGLALAEDGISIPETEVVQDGQSITLTRRDFSATVDRSSGLLTEIVSKSHPQGALGDTGGLGGLSMISAGEVDHFDSVEVKVTKGRDPKVVVDRRRRDGVHVQVTYSLAPEIDAVDMAFEADDLPKPDGGMNNGLQTRLNTATSDVRLMHDHPLSVSEIRADTTHLKKYPTTLDWMNSPQFFEEVSNPFSSLHMVDIGDESGGVLFIHDGSQQMFREGDSVRALLTMCDPWDGTYWRGEVSSKWRVWPHAAGKPSELWKTAQEFLRPVITKATDRPSGQLDPERVRFECEGAGAIVTAFFRAADERSDAVLVDYAGSDVDKPFVLRIVEFDGAESAIRLRIPGEVGFVRRTNLLGESDSELTKQASFEEGVSTIDLSLEPHEIVTLYVDIALGRRQVTDVDVNRPAWVEVAESEHELQR